MPTFGDYESAGEPLAVINLQGHISTVWKARKTGARDSRDFVIKCYAPHRRSKEGGQEESLDRDRGLEFLEGVKQLKKAQTKGARHLSPIHDLGISSEGAWYVTDYYPRGSLMALIERRAKVDSAALRQIVRCIVSGCLALKESRGVSHGNLKASNVFLAGKPRPLPKTPLLLADPYPAAPLQLARLDMDDRKTVGELLHQVMEVQDLRALGEIILQLVERRPVRSGYDYNYPIGRSEAWDNFGKDGERWRQICNQLLDPQLSLREINLESLAKKFPAGVAGNKLVAIASALLVICLIAGGAYGFMRWKGSTEPRAGEGAMGQKDYDAAMQNGRAKLKAGDYTGAMSQADLALESKPNDKAARQLKTDAKAQQNATLAAGQRQKDYDAAMQSGRTKLKAGDYAGAMTQADVALESKPNDKAARQLKTDAKAQQNATLTAGQRQKDYDSAMQNGRTKLKAGDYAGAMTQADVALESKPNDEAARQLKTDAKAQQNATLTAAQKQKDYDAAIQNGRAKLKAGDYAGAMTQADLALESKPDDEAARQLKTDAKAQQNATLTAAQKQKDYNAAIQNGRAKLKAGDYADAMKQADVALESKPNDEAARQLKTEAKAQQDTALAAAQRQKDYDLAMQNGRAKFKAGDYADAMTQADVALESKPNDEAARQLKTEAKAQQDTALAAAQRQKDYDLAMQNGRAKLKAGDYADAMTQADVALESKPNDEAARQLKTEAKAQQDTALAAAQRQKDYDAAMQGGRAKLKAGDYADAMKQADVALANKPDDEAARQLKTDAKAQQDAALAAAQKQKDYDTAMQSGRAKLKAADYAGTMTQADLALESKPNDEAARQLKADAKTRQTAVQMAEDQRSAQDFFAKGQYEQVAALCGKYPDVGFFKNLALTNRFESIQLAQMTTSLNSGDYSFVDGLEAANYRTKPPFADLLVKAKPQVEVLNTLEGLTNNPDNQPKVNSILNEPSNASFIFKRGFTPFRNWAVQHDPIRQLNAQLEVFEVWFGVKPPNDQIIDPSTQKTAQKLPRTIVLDDYYTLLDELKTKYKNLKVPDSSYKPRTTAVENKMHNWD